MRVKARGENSRVYKIYGNISYLNKLKKKKKENMIIYGNSTAN